jgi:hypothetical protein
LLGRGSCERRWMVKQNRGNKRPSKKNGFP